MADIQAIIPINIDFSNKKYVLINAKQYDKKSRYILFSCYNNNEFFHVDKAACTAFVRYRKADDYGVFNKCTITDEGRVLTELTEQMLAVSGLCSADLIIVKGRSVQFDEDGNIVGSTAPNILSTMTFYVDVTETPIENSSIESTYDYSGFNQALEEIKSDYSDVIKMAKSYAVGGTNRRVGEDTDNAKYYYEQSAINASSSKTNVSSASNSEKNAKEYMNNALTYSQNAQTYMNNANTYMGNAKTSETNAKTSEQNAKLSETNAKTSEANSKASETKASTSEANAKTSESKALVSEQNAKTSENNALNYANKSQSYAVGDTGTREGEDEDNARYYYERVKNIITGLDSGFIPMGTVSFSELSTVEKLVGYVYNIRDDFVTDENFAEGAGKSYTAGTNVYFTASGVWDCFGGAASPTATVSEVKDYLGINEEIEIV